MLCIPRQASLVPGLGFFKRIRLQFDCWQCLCGAPASCCVLQLCRLPAPDAWRQRLTFGCMEHPAMPCCHAGCCRDMADSIPDFFYGQGHNRAHGQTNMLLVRWRDRGLAMRCVGWLPGWLAGWLCACIHVVVKCIFLKASCVECQLRACARRASSLLPAAAAMLPLNSSAGGVPLDPLSPPLVGPQR